MQRKGPLPGKICALCIPERRFAGLFGCMAREYCQSQLVLDARRRYVAREGRFPRPRPLQGYMKRENCHGKASENELQSHLASKAALPAAKESRMLVFATSHPSPSAGCGGALLRRCAPPRWRSRGGAALVRGPPGRGVGSGISPYRGLIARNSFESALFRWASMSPLRVLRSCAVSWAEAKSALTFI